VILASGPMLDLDPEILGLPDPGSAAEASGTLESLEEVETGHILKALGQAQWVIEGPRGAAAILGLHPNTLRSRLKKLGLSRPPHEPS
jgi:formate hydrogenlyase transcriptional activator